MSPASLEEGQSRSLPQPKACDAAIEPVLAEPAHSERDWYWKPLSDALGSAEAERFEWKAETGTIQTYEHRETFRYVHVDSVTGHFYNQQCEVITKDAALAHALPVLATSAPVEEPSREPGLGAFTRTHVPTPEAGLDVWGGVVSGFDHFSTLNWPGEIVGMLAIAKRKVLAGLGTGTAHDREGKARLVHAERELKEPSLATFMRRTSELER